MLLVCPRCSGSLPPDARACPRCGLLLSSVATSDEASANQDTANGRDAAYAFGQESAPYIQTQPVEYDQTSSEPVGGGTQPYSPYSPSSSSASAPQYSIPVRPVSSDVYAVHPPPISEEQVAPTPADESAAASSLLVPKGAVEMLPNESVAFQLGALYLTNKRVILLAPSVLRTAFLRDVDAIGTLTERASGWSFFFGLLLLALAGGAVYVSTSRAQLAESLDALSKIEPIQLIIIAVVLAIFAIYLLVNYFFWVKRTLFLSVGGRPLITVSITDWNAKKLAGMDSFINAFSQVKDGTNT